MANSTKVIVTSYSKPVLMIMVNFLGKFISGSEIKQRYEGCSVLLYDICVFFLLILHFDEIILCCFDSLIRGLVLQYML